MPEPEKSSKTFKMIKIIICFIYYVFLKLPFFLKITDTEFQTNDLLHVNLPYIFIKYLIYGLNFEDLHLGWAGGRRESCSQRKNKVIPRTFVILLREIGAENKICQVL